MIEIEYVDWMATLDSMQVVCYRRPDFLSHDFEYENYIGVGYLRNIFKNFVIDEKTEHITLSFPERWINIIEQAQLFIRLQHYYPNLKKLFIKTHAATLIMHIPAQYIVELGTENEAVEASGRGEEIDVRGKTSAADSLALFPGISTGTLFNNGNPIEKTEKT